MGVISLLLQKLQIIAIIIVINVSYDIYCLSFYFSGEMTDSFEVSIEAFLDPDPTRRPKLSTLMADKLFK